MFVIKTECKQANSGTKEKSLVTREGEKVWVVKEPDGWVEATSTSIHLYPEPPQDCKTFETYAAAEKFIKRWKGHPWYYVPNGNYEIIEVEPKYKQVVNGFQKK
jgi:hypothetical protein